MKKLLLIPLLALAAFGAQAQNRNDLNQDGEVNVGDVTTLVNAILGKGGKGTDLNLDGNINVGDVTTLVDVILGKIPGGDTSDPTAGTLVTVTQMDDGNYTDGLLYYSVTSPVAHEVKVVGVRDEKIEDVIVPEAVGINHVKFTVASVGADAFKDLGLLKSVRLPAGITSIGEQAFLNCSKMQSVNIPAAVARIGSAAFKYCGALKNISLPMGLSEITDETFFGCYHLSNVTIPITVASFGRNAFYDCHDLRSVEISNLDSWLNMEFANAEANPLHYGHQLFLNGTAVTSVEIPSTFKRINDYVFNGFTGMQKLTIPNSVIEVGTAAFEHCSGLQALTIDMTDVPTTFKGYPIQTLTLGNSVKTLKGEAFASCRSLSNVTFGKAVEEIGQYAFSGCEALKIVKLPGSVTSIGAEAFSGCYGLTNVTLSDKLQGIGSGAFKQCTSLAEIYIPAAVTSIGAYAFASCGGLTSVIVKREVPADYNCVMSAFSADTYNIATLQVPAGCGKVYLQCSPWSMFATIKDGSATYNGSGCDAAVEAGLCPDASHPHVIDMGAAGKWACCNVGASNPFEYGGYYAWGETEEKSEYSSRTYHVTVNTDITGNVQYDVAAKKWGGAWKMPTLNRIEALVDCSNEWTTVGGVNGRLFTASNGNRLFLPAAGYRYAGGLSDAGSRGIYWSSSAYPLGSNYAYYLNFGSDGAYWYDGHLRYYGFSVRPVAE